MKNETFTQVPFTYLIGWTAANKWYYGVRFAKSAHPSTLWVSYFTSSKKVATLRKELGEPDVIQVRRTFETPKQATTWESTVLRRMKVLQRNDLINGAYCNADGSLRAMMSEETKAKRNQWYQDPNNKAKLKSFKGKKHTAETKAKMSQQQKDHPRIASPETRAKIGAASKGRQSFLGRRHSEETKDKLRSKVVSDETKEKMRIAAAKKPKVSDETRLKQSIARTGTKKSDETKAKMRATWAKKKAEGYRPPEVSEETRAKHRAREARLRVSV